MSYDLLDVSHRVEGVACTASAISSQEADAMSPNVTLKLKIGSAGCVVWYSDAMPRPAKEVMPVKPAPGVGTKAPCWTPATMMSLGLLIESETDVPHPVPVADAGSPNIGSNGLLKLAPVMPKT